MIGIVRAPVPGVSFAIPYSGTPKAGDCILVADSSGDVNIAARYLFGAWDLKNYITNFSAGNNVISFKANNVDRNGRAAFIPGPNYV